MKFRWILIACLALTTSCGKEIPGDIIQPRKMENVLYDYHLSMGMSGNSKNTEKEALKKYVFQKHGITEAEFDSSMVWYTRESNELLAIYTNLDKRFTREYEHVGRLLESRDESSTRMSMSGDTVDIWRKGKIHWFSNAPLKQKLTFEIKADTTFHEKDAFFWDMDYFFMKPGKAIMAMSIVYDNDSVTGKTLTVTESGPQSIYLYSDSAFKVKEVNGFIYVPNDSLQETNILIHKMTLNRYHRLLSDSLMTDSIQLPKRLEKNNLLEKKDSKSSNAPRIRRKNVETVETIEMEELTPIE